MPHVVRDRNGTLVDDQSLVVEGLNAVLDDAGSPRVDPATYQRLYTRPVHRFYERIFGRPIADTEWAHIDEVVHAAYRAALDRVTLAADAQPALTALDQAGIGQSLVSMWRHEELLPLVSRFGIAQRFARIDGLRGSGGGVKAPHLAAHVGARCILYDDGSHPRDQLEQAGVPVASTLTEALKLAGLR